MKAKKKIAEENIQKAVEAALEMADVATSDGKAFCISRVNVGSDTTAIREAVVRVMEQKVASSLPANIFFQNVRMSVKFA